MSVSSLIVSFPFAADFVPHLTLCIGLKGKVVKFITVGDPIVVSLSQRLYPAKLTESKPDNGNHLFYINTSQYLAL